MRWITVALAVVALTAPAAAQAPDTRPATTTFLGDTGLWFVPTGETLPDKAFSLSVHRTDTSFRQGNTNVSLWPITGAIGFGRVELFGSMRVVTRIDRDTSPLLFAGPDNEAGGLVNDFPRVNESWTGNTLGDLLLGGKWNLASQRRQNAMAFSLRGILKLPTGDEDKGASTGKYDGMIDVIGSREMNRIEVSGFGGVTLRGDPDDISLSDSLRWGGGAAFPSRGALRGTAEIQGEWNWDHAVQAAPGVIVGADGSLSPSTSRLKDAIDTMFGLTYQHRSGVLLSAGVSYRFGLETEVENGLPVNDSGDAIGVQFRIGFHRGVGVYVAPPPAVAALPAPAPAPAPPVVEAPAPVAANRAPGVRAVCDPCTLTPGGVARLRAEVMDPDGDPVTVLWSATGGTLTDVRAMMTEWRAETAPGLVTFTVVAEDSRGARATDTVTIEVAAGEDAFEHILFNFDSAALRPEALPLLDPVIATMRARPEVNLVIEGHTCDIGTVEYNLALGERRANAVRDYLVSRGIAASRLTTVSFGEEHPAHANTNEASRKLNRRAVLNVRGAAPDTSTR